MSSNYKNTLNLPRASFNMKANLKELEPRILSYWETIKIYEKAKGLNKGREKFILHDGPPYANGLIHLGHTLNKILKDIVLKYKILKGYYCPFIVGWDCHGLPVEHQLLKELNLTKHDVNILNFRKKAKEFALKFVELQRKDFKRLGVFGDWNIPYLTFNPEYEYWVIDLLRYLVKEGYIYRKKYPVNWCKTCETALAEAEVEYLDKESDSIYLLFETKDDKGIFEEKVYFLVWTTTPWTLVSNVAVALHPEFEYALVKYQQKSILLSKDLIPSLETKLNIKLELLKTFKGENLKFILLKHPFLEKDSLVVSADFVSKEEGSGCVHIAPGHGEEDYSLVKKYNLEIIMPLNQKGIFEEPPEFKGKDIESASKEVIKKLKEKGLILKHEKITHSYPHCWRCKNAIIFRATYQWFLKIDHKNLREKLAEEIEKVKWVPSSGKERITSMIRQRPDWCLSRQRLWGVPIPSLKCENCHQAILDVKVMEKVAKIFREKSSDSWFVSKIEEFLPQNFICPNCGGKNFEKENDILDVWFESGASFSAVLKRNEELSFPADMYLEGSDQHRGWFQVSLIPSVAKESVAPFKIVLTHGFVVDGEGRKMSKSLGNVISPQEIIEKYGAEILRLWCAYSDYTQDIKVSHKILSQLVDIYRKIRNTLRFIVGNLYDFNSKDAPSYSQLLELDRYILSKLMLLFKEVEEDYENFNFYKVIHKIFDFCNLDLSSFYLDVLKDRLYTFVSCSLERRSAQVCLYHVLNVLIKLLSPILSFTCEEIYFLYKDILDNRESVFLTSLNNLFFSQWIDKELIKKWKRILKLRDLVLKEMERKREEGLIGSSLEAEVILKFNENDFSFYQSYQDALREVLIVSNVNIEKGDFEVKIEKARGKKCLRCWNWRKDVGKNKEFPDICERCAKVLKC